MSTKGKTQKETTQVIDFAFPNKENVDNFVKAGTDAAAKGYEHVAQLTSDQVEKASAALFKGYEDASALNKQAVDAVVKSGSVVAKAAEEFGKAWVAYTQRSIEGGMATAKAVIGSRSLREAVDLQSQYARDAFDDFVSESGRLSEYSVKIANEAIEPIKSHVTTAVEKLLKSQAA